MPKRKRGNITKKKLNKGEKNKIQRNRHKNIENASKLHIIKIDNIPSQILKKFNITFKSDDILVKRLFEIKEKFGSSNN